MVLGKDKLNTIEVLISMAFIDSCVNHDEFVSVNNELNEMKKKKIIKSWKLCGTHYTKATETYCHSCKKYTANKINRLML